MALPIDPTMLTNGAEWQIQAPTVGNSGVAQPSGGQSFGGALTQAIQGLSSEQTQAADASQSLAAGTATDPSSVVMAVERAQLSMQLASQIRTKAVEAESDIFHTQV
jgi:flagellar hook-basal body complex protein FliE